MTASTVPGGFLFNKTALFTLGVTTLWAASKGFTGLVMLCGLLMVSSVLARVWAGLSLKKVSFERSLDKRMVFPGETVRADIDLSNGKFLPVFWVSVEERIHTGLLTETSLSPSSTKGLSVHSSTMSLPGYARARWHHTLTCSRRGWYPLGYAALTSGDLFGFYQTRKTVRSQDEILVFPSLYTLVSDHLPIHSPLGETRADHTLYQDPSRVVGLRDYTPFDSLRHVHWKASARRKQMQVKVFESTVSVKTAIFLCVDHFTALTGGRQRFEDAISAAASIAVRLIERHSPVGFFANAKQAGTGHPVEINPENSHSHVIKILEIMARCLFRAHGSFSDLVTGKLSTLPCGCTLLFILSHPADDIRQKLNELITLGHRIMVLDLGEPSADDSPWLVSDYYYADLEHDKGLLHMKRKGS